MGEDQASVQLQKVVDELAAVCGVKPFQVKDIPFLIHKPCGHYQMAVYNHARLILEGKSNKAESINQLKGKIAKREKELRGKTSSQKSNKYYDNILAEFRYNYKLYDNDFNKALNQTVEMMDCAEEDVHNAIEVQGRGLLWNYQES